jgi:hypothetical protein
VGAIGRTVGRHSSQRSSSSVTVRDREPLWRPAPISSGKSGLDLLGLAHRGLGLAGDLLAHIPLSAGERVTAGVDLWTWRPSRRLRITVASSAGHAVLVPEE